MMPELIYITLDGVPTPKAQCPKCGIWGYLDEDQFYGRVSIKCGAGNNCTYHRTNDFSKEYRNGFNNNLIG